LIFKIRPVPRNRNGGTRALPDDMTYSLPLRTVIENGFPCGSNSGGGTAGKLVRKYWMGLATGAR